MGREEKSDDSFQQTSLSYACLITQLLMYDDFSIIAKPHMTKCPLNGPFELRGEPVPHLIQPLPASASFAGPGANATQRGSPQNVCGRAAWKRLRWDQGHGRPGQCQMLPPG